MNRTMNLRDATRTTRRHLSDRGYCDDRGLTTLEWLLIVAAVAGLAALAVVLVTNVVRDTSDDISGQSARLTAARIAAGDVTSKARAATNPSGDPAAVTLNGGFRSDCHEIGILYGDVPSLKMIWSEDITTATASPAVEPTAQSATMTEDIWKSAAKTKRGCWAWTP